MKAIIQQGYGAPREVLRLAEIDKPIPTERQVLVKVVAASVNSGDWRQAVANPPIIRLMLGLRSPRQPGVGVDAAGVVEAVGADVNGVRPGDEVFGMRQATFAEYVAGASFVHKPKNLSFLEAAALPAAGCTALQALRDHGKVQPGQHVLVNGAGGGVGHLAVQLAKAFGAEVTATTSPSKLDLVRSLGADQVIDYSREDFTRTPKRFDLIIDCGSDRPLGATLRTLRHGGRLVLVGAHKRVLTRIALCWLRSRLLRQRITFFVASGDFRENLATLADLVEAGKLKPEIDRVFPLGEAPAAVEYAALQQIAGKVAISVAEDS